MEDEGSAAPFSLGGILSEPRIDGGEVSRSSIHGPLTSFTSLTSADLSGWRVRLVPCAESLAMYPRKHGTRQTGGSRFGGEPEWTESTKVYEAQRSELRAQRARGA